MSSKNRRGGGESMPREVTVSKAMSFVLRHGAEKEGIKLNKQGYANVADLLAWHKLQKLQVTLSELKQIVAENDKQRFSLIPLPPSPDGLFDTPLADSLDPSTYLIRANQGHSIIMDSASLLTPLTSDTAPDTVVHGTFYGAWPLILSSGGLSKMGRNHVHFALGVPGGEKPVISGMRADAQVLVYVDVRKAMGGGLGFWRSENGVVLSEGDGRGMVGLEFVRKVEGRRDGVGVLWEEGKVVGELPERLGGSGVPRGKGRSRKSGRGGRDGGKGRIKEDGADDVADGTVNDGPPEP